MDEAERLFCTPRVQTEWCLARKHIPFLGGVRALAHESIAENERLGAELDDLHLFLPGALGWAVPRSDDDLSASLYHLAATGAVKILSLNAFSLPDVDHLLSAGRLAPPALARLAQRPGAGAYNRGFP